MKIISFWIAEIFLRYKWKGWSIRRQNEESKTTKWGFSKMQVEDCLLNGKDYFVFCRKWISCIWSHIQTWKEKTNLFNIYEASISHLTNMGVQLQVSDDWKICSLKGRVVFSGCSNWRLKPFNSKHLLLHENWKLVHRISFYPQAVISKVNYLNKMHRRSLG